MKLKYFFFNIIIIIVLLLIFDFLFYCYINSKLTNEKIKFDIKSYVEAAKIKKFDDVYKQLNDTNYFRHIKTNNNDKTIMLFGCSYAYGYLLNENQTLAYKLSKTSGYNINNQSISSLGIQYFPYILEHFDINVDAPPKYIIFVMIENHVYRLYRYYYQDTDAYLDIRYKNTKEGLKEIKHKIYILEHLFIYRYLQNKYAWFMFTHKRFDENFDFMKLHFLKAQELVKTKFPNSKIVILVYEDDFFSEFNIYNTERWKELENEGFIILGTHELTGKNLFEDKYKIPNDIHPNEYAWDLIVPALVKRLDL